MTFEVPVKPVNDANGSHGHWAVRSRRRKQQRSAAFLAARAAGVWPAILSDEGGVHVLISRFYKNRAHTMDVDGLLNALKPVRDGVADALGLRDNDARLTWDYTQAVAGRAMVEVSVSCK